MWIHSIKLSNFKSYQDAEFQFPEPQNGENIVLIGAENGHGKTTLLEAIYLCLYDSDALNQLQRAGVNDNTRSYPEYLEAALYHDAQASWGQYRIKLEMEIRQRKRGNIHGFKIARTWHFNENRKLQRDDTETQGHILQAGDYRPIADEDIRNYLNLFALPFDYAPFFFFDGEKIVNMAKQSGAGNWLNVALKGLLGLTLLNSVQESLQRYRTNLISQNASERLIAALQDADSKLRLSQATLDVYQQELAEIEHQWQVLNQKHEDLINTLGGGGDIRTSADLMEQRQRLEQEVEQFQNQVKAAIKAMPLAFLPRDKIQQLKNTLLKDNNRLNHEAGKSQIAERVDEFWQEFVENDKVRQALGNLAEPILRQPLMYDGMRDCWESLFYPLPENCAETIQHNYLSRNAHAEIQNEISNLQGMPQDQIGNLLAQMQQREREKSRVLEELNLLQGSGRDKLVEELKTVAKERDTVTQRKGHIKSNVLAHEKNTERLRQEVVRLQDQISENNPQLLKSNRARKIHQVIEELTTALLQQKVTEISETATRINHSIAHDQRIHQITIEPSGKMVLRGRDGKVSSVDLSAGQMQILIMSLVSALAEVTQYHAPFVIDTPLARLDMGHREGLFRHWSGLSQQVILLSQDSEITPEICRRLKPHIACTYLVKADSLNSAGAHSQVQANAYFE